ncbi:hypothetical protein J2125_003422 [Erwinia toletana]|uniref:Uncharacterized protein n=1 Tax=Winslowiella toletana TaxID=92490 RepID=A0ABS4PDM8_9GAMM|nr:hypothetical protein [Winslowiella toletana]MBP2170230.1 hypothetical protein [Winslowiella toletana]
MIETLYLFSNPTNASHINASLPEFERRETIEIDVYRPDSPGNKEPVTTTGRKSTRKYSSLSLYRIQVISRTPSGPANGLCKAQGLARRAERRK